MKDLKIEINMSDEDDFCFRFYVDKPCSLFDTQFPYSTTGHEQGLRLIKSLCRGFINEDSEAFTEEYRAKLKKEKQEMSVMGTKTISAVGSHSFDKMVKSFLDKKEDLILHDQTKFGITQEDYYDDEHGKMTRTLYSVIFYGELG